MVKGRATLVAMKNFPASAPAIGAIVYPPDRPPEVLMRQFATELKARGFRLGGLVQETVWGEDGGKCGMEVVELDTGQRLNISQALGVGSGACMLDPAALADASGALRRAIETRVDLLIVNKFSKAEKSGRGLAAEMLAAMAEGVPLLTALPGVLVEEWTAFTGGRGQLLMPTTEALWRWWGPRRLYEDLEKGVGAAPARRVLVGFNWTMVEGPDGIGLAQTPERGTPGCRAPGFRTGDGGWEGRPLDELARLVHSPDPIEAAVGVAAINAHYNRFDLAALDINGLDTLDQSERLVVIGAFPGLSERLPGALVVERKPGPGQFPAEAAEWLLPSADGVIITASTLGNRSLPHLLRLAEGAPVALVGPGAPLTPRLFPYGIAASSGLIVTDPDGLARAVTEGGGAKDLKRYARRATIRAG